MTNYISEDSKITRTTSCIYTTGVENWCTRKSFTKMIGKADTKDPDSRFQMERISISLTFELRLESRTEKVGTQPLHARELNNGDTKS